MTAHIREVKIFQITYPDTVFPENKRNQPIDVVPGNFYIMTIVLPDGQTVSYDSSSNAAVASSNVDIRVTAKDLRMKLGNSRVCFYRAKTSEELEINDSNDSLYARQLEIAEGIPRNYKIIDRKPIPPISVSNFSSYSQTLNIVVRKSSGPLTVYTLEILAE